MALYYNGIMVSGINFTPRLTLAEYNALEVKPDYWIRTDAESNNITASDIDCTSSGGTTTDVQTELNNKVDKETGKGLFSGSYTDLTDKPTIPTDFVSKSSGGVFNGNVSISTPNNYSQLVLGNDTTTNRGLLNIFSNNDKYLNIRAADDQTGNHNVYFPNKAGTLAMTSDIPTDFVPKSSGGTFAGNVAVDRGDGTTTSVGSSVLTIGNATAEGSANNSKGQIRLYSNTAYRIVLTATGLSASRSIEFPNKAGTIALTSDIPTLPSTSTINTTHGLIYAYGGIRILQTLTSSTLSFTIPGLVSWNSEIPSGSRPSKIVAFTGQLVDANSNVKADVSGSILTNGNIDFEVSNGTTGNYYIRATAMWAV